MEINDGSLKQSKEEDIQKINDLNEVTNSGKIKDVKKCIIKPFKLK